MPGRFEVLGHQPLVIVDGAHNPPGADSCAQVFFDDFDPAGRKILVAGCLRAAIRKRCSRRCGPTSSTPSSPALRRRHAGVPVGGDRRRGPVDRAATTCTSAAPSSRPASGRCAMAEHDDAVLATGSLYVVGAARPHLRKII